MNKTNKNNAKKAIKPPDKVRSMFDVVAERYDLVNRLLTFGLDQRWRRITARATGAGKNSLVLDACTGTGDLAFAVNSVTGSKVIGVDFSEDMLFIAREKAAKFGLNSHVSFVMASVDNLPFEDNKFDAVTIGFGLRNTPDYKAVLQEFCRVTRSGGRLVCLESSMPDCLFLKIPHRIYLTLVVPTIGRIASNNYQAYKYLSDSTQIFPSKKELACMMKEAGWADATYKILLGGAIAIHIATKG